MGPVVNNFMVRKMDESKTAKSNNLVAILMHKNIFSLPPKFSRVLSVFCYFSKRATRTIHLSIFAFSRLNEPENVTFPQFSNMCT